MTRQQNSWRAARLHVLHSAEAEQQQCVVDSKPCTEDADRLESKVHAVVRNVPKGKVTTYGAVAKAVAAHRAVSRSGAVAPPRRECTASDRVDRRCGFSGEWGVGRAGGLKTARYSSCVVDGRVSAACVIRELPAPGKRSRADDKAAPPVRSRKAPSQAELAAETLRILEARDAGKMLTVGGAAARGPLADWRSWMRKHAAVRDLVGRVPRRRLAKVRR